MRTRIFADFILIMVGLLTFFPAQAQLVNQPLWKNFEPYFGVDVQNRELRFERPFGANIFTKNLAQTDIYGGIKFLSYFALNIGRENSQTKDRNVNLIAGDTFLGLLLPPGDSESDFSQTKISGTHIDFVLYYPICRNQEIEIFASLGRVRNHLQLTQVQTAQDNILLTSPIARTYDVKSTNLRATAGIQKTFCDHIGIRALIGWEDTANFYDLKPLENPEADTFVRLKASFIYSIGLFVIL